MNKRQNDANTIQFFITRDIIQHESDKQKGISDIHANLPSIDVL